MRGEPQDNGTDCHGNRGAPLGAAAHKTAVLPVHQHGAKQPVAHQPAVQARGAAGCGPRCHQDKNRGGQAGHDDTNHPHHQAQHRKHQQQPAHGTGQGAWGRVGCGRGHGKGYERAQVKRYCAVPGMATRVQKGEKKAANAALGGMASVARSVHQLQRALHDAGVARERAEESVAVGGGELLHGERDGVRFAGAEHLGVGNYAGVPRLDVLVGNTCRDAVCRYSLHISRFGQHPVVAHGRLGQFAGVFQLDGEVLACLADVNIFQVELHCIVAFDLDGAVGRGHGGTRGGGKHTNGQQRTDGRAKNHGTCHGNLSKKARSRKPCADAGVAPCLNFRQVYVALVCARSRMGPYVVSLCVPCDVQAPECEVGMLNVPYDNTHPAP